MLKLYEDRKIKYNYLKLTITQEYKTPKSNQEQRINEIQLEDESLNDYTN